MRDETPKSISRASYQPDRVEKKWQKAWEKHSPTAEDFSDRPKRYLLVEFPYPSGDGLHVGHVRSYSAFDALARYSRLRGFNVLYPMGFDAFGLPTENYAIKHKIHPREATDKNMANFERQMRALGLSFDWSRAVDTTDPQYYKWTQWIFLQLLKKGLAYQATMPINWCPKDKIGLANEEVIAGKCERCGTEVTRKLQKQWMLKITAYAERLLKDLDTVDYLPKIKTQQVNWIGKSEGAEIQFTIQNSQLKIPVFTTRPDTIFGATYLVVAPEHPFVQDAKSEIRNWQEVQRYLEQAAKKSDLERTDLAKEKTGVELKGIKAINPANNEEIPIWVADYVLSSYGTGAIMAVPAHDERDFEFAKKYELPIREVVIPYRFYQPNPPVPGKKTGIRTNVHAIIRNPKNGKILALKWKKFAWTTFPMGGVEAGEDIIQAAEREVREETGYRHLRYDQTLGGPVKSEYFAAHKDENRISYTHAVCFTLIDDKRDVVSSEEQEKYEIVWIDERDMKPETMTHAELDVWIERLRTKSTVFTGNGVLIHSGKFNDSFSEEAAKKIVTELKKQGVGKPTVQYKLRDWVFSRQHYWGEPIPVVHCEKCGVIPVPEDQLPVELPHVKKYEPTDTGESPLAAMTEWVNTTCPSCGGPAKRETDTMPNWAGSSWYYLRYTDPDNEQAFADQKKLKYWLPVDIYNGGMEHTTLHLLYSRFWHKFLYDEGLVPTVEPYQHRHSHGMVLAEDGRKMSKSWGNVINPDAVVEEHGADSLRLYEMFMGPFEDTIPWSTKGLLGTSRFLNNIWKLYHLDYQAAEAKNDRSDEIERGLHRTIKKVTDDFESFSFNTIVSTLMEYANALRAVGAGEVDLATWRNVLRNYLLLLFPLAPHIASELWEIRDDLSGGEDIQAQGWPEASPALLTEAAFTLIVQVNGKVRGRIEAETGIDEAGAIAAVQADSKLAELVNGHTKVIYVPNRLINFIV